MGFAVRLGNVKWWRNGSGGIIASRSVRAAVWRPNSATYPRQDGGQKTTPLRVTLSNG